MVTHDPHDANRQARFDAAYRRGFDEGEAQATALFVRARAVMPPAERLRLAREIEARPDIDLLRHRVETAERRHRESGARPNLVVIR